VKRCRKCGESKPLSDFYAMPGMRDGHRNECIACSRAYRAARYRSDPQGAKARVRAWRESNPERYRDTQRRIKSSPAGKRRDRDGHLRRKFGLTAEEYDALLQCQDGRCAICREPGNDSIALHVDHDHVTGRVRGLLCFRCNGGLGQFREEPELLRRAAWYVENSGDPVREGPR
jgi:Recombination endonuclease VII